MKKYNSIFPTFHSLYRLITTSSDIKNFAIGVSRIYKRAFKADYVIMVCTNFNSHTVLKAYIDNSKQYVKKGGTSILSRREKDILAQEKEIFLDNRLIYPFTFINNLGAIYVKRMCKSKPFNEIDRKWFLALSEEVSISLKIYNLAREHKKVMMHYLDSLTSLLDRYVPTSFLNKKVALRFIRFMAKKMNLTETEVKTLEYASLLHDTGKMRIPFDLLSKRKPLTKEEVTMIRKHPQHGIQFIKDLELLKPIIPIILHHHERYDGTGYPSRLKKEKIPFGSRILAVIDAFDAMYFGRPYKKKKTLKEIEAELIEQSGKQFDPKVVTVFLKILAKTEMKRFLGAQ